MDKNKIIQAATKFVQKGQFDKAIKEYQKIIEEDPKDIRILQKIGELHQKRGDNVQAAQTFIKVAESYSNDGFFLKAAAVYKQVLKLNSSLVDTNLKLAELYQQLGLMSDALQQFQLVAAAYERQGDVQASLGILKKVVELDPENIGNRIRLAESYSREGMNEEAIREFSGIAGTLKQNHRADEYVKVAERLAFLDPQNMGLCRELANVYLAKGDTKRALAKLQICFKADPRDVETLTLLAQAFKDLGQEAKTVSVYKELARIYAETDRLDDEKAIWRKIAAIAPEDPDLGAWQESHGGAVAPAPAPRPSPAQPARAPVRASPSTATRGMGADAVPKLLTEMDVYLKYGLHAKAAEHLKKILALAPDSLSAHERAKDLYVTLGDSQRAAEELATVVRLALDAGDLDRAQAGYAELQETAPDHPQLAALSEALGSPVEVAEVSEDAILVEASDEEVLVAAEDEAADVSPLEEAAPVIPEGADESLFADEPAPAVVEEEVAEELVEDEALGVVDGSPEDHALVTDDDAEALMEEEMALPAAEVESTPFDQPDGEAADFNPSEEATTIAQLPDLGGEMMAEPTLAEEPESSAAPDGLEEPALPRSPAAPMRANAPAAPPPVVSEPEEEPEELAEAEFFVEQQLWDEAEEVLSHLRARLGDASSFEDRLRDLERRLAVGKGGPAPLETTGNFDLAAELESEVTSAGLPSDGEDFQYSVEDVLREFKKGVERTVRPEDVETHYDLGIAYKEMGLVDEAMGEFELAAAGAKGKPREADCLAMIGLCAGGKGDLARAAEAYERALTVNGLRPETAINLQYEVGAAREGLGQAGVALAAFEKVAKIDPGYRDVAACLERLKGARKLNGIDGPKGDGGGRPPAGGGPAKPRKVGYL